VVIRPAHADLRILGKVCSARSASAAFSYNLHFLEPQKNPPMVERVKECHVEQHDGQGIGV
jgi:hypothetical protein